MGAKSSRQCVQGSPVPFISSQSDGSRAESTRALSRRMRDENTKNKMSIIYRFIDENANAGRTSCLYHLEIDKNQPIDVEYIKSRLSLDGYLVVRDKTYVNTSSIHHHFQIVWT